ncbi:MAG: hypothetical protein EHM93_01970 [Bacteroidales bacterium]|nr:MAG: hypothetical protein EHM93_01970 [Bacteroidales bacterium]
MNMGYQKNLTVGAGAFRGMQAQESAIIMDIFKAWLNFVNESRFQPISPYYSCDPDHISFSDAGSQGFQFIQDPQDNMLIFHSNMDIIEHIPADDIQFNTTIMALIAYLTSQPNNSLSN